MAHRKPIDLLRVSAADESRAIESRLEGDEGDALFPESFSASGFNNNIRFAALRVSSED